MADDLQLPPADPLGRYYTPESLWYACLRGFLQAFRRPSYLIEPCVGGGSLLRAVPRAWRSVAPSAAPPTCLVGDLDPDAPGLALGHGAPFVGDFEQMGERYRAALPADREGPTLITTNPNYAGKVADLISRFRDFQRTVGADYLGLLLRGNAQEKFFKTEVPTLVWTSDKRTTWEGPAAQILLEREQLRENARAAKKGRKPRKLKRASTDWVGAVFCVWTLQPAAEREYRTRELEQWR